MSLEHLIQHFGLLRNLIKITTQLLLCEAGMVNNNYFTGWSIWWLFIYSAAITKVEYTFEIVN